MEEEVEGAEEQQQFSYRQRLKAAVHYTVGCLCEEVASDKEVQLSKQTIAAISEVTFRQCDNFAKDLEMFARNFQYAASFYSFLLLHLTKNKILTQQPDGVIEVADWKFSPEVDVIISGQADIIHHDEMTHAKRSTINTEDVKLLARRSNSLLKYITGKNEEITQFNVEQKAKKKKKLEDENKDSLEPAEAGGVRSEN